MAAGGARSLGGGRVVRWSFGGTQDGNLALSEPIRELDSRRQRPHPGDWLWLRQVHGADIVDGTDGDLSRCGSEADGVFTGATGLVLAVHTADCCPVLMWSEPETPDPDSPDPDSPDPIPGALVGAVHAGWRGLEAGAIERLAASMRGAGAQRLAGVLGPCICPSCYEFGATELDRLASRFGDEVRATSRSGAPSLDVRAAVRAACESADVRLEFPATESNPPCTAHGGGHFSFRARRDSGRQASTIELCAEETAEPRR